MSFAPRPPVARRPWVLAAFVLVVAACAGPAAPATPFPDASSSPVASPATNAPPRWVPGLPDLPAEARASSGGPAPRPAAYWALWNSCAPVNRAAEAAANGGRAAGFVLIDDLLAQPGIGLGDHRLADCDEALAVLAAGDGSEPASIERLAAQVLVAELDLGVGSETCPAAEEAVIGGQTVLAAAGYRGPDVPVDVPGGEAGTALPALVTILAAYTTGALCE